MEKKEFCFKVNMSKLDNKRSRKKLEKQVNKVKNRINERLGCFKDVDFSVYYEIGLKIVEKEKFILKICYK